MPELNDQQVKALEVAIANIKDTIKNLRLHISETEIEIGRLENVKSLLTRQLPTDNRIDHLFN